MPITTSSNYDDNTKTTANALKEACAESDAIRKRRGKPQASASKPDPDFRDEGFTAAVYEKFNAGKKKPVHPRKPSARKEVEQQPPA
jgi:hypothetical protein